MKRNIAILLIMLSITLVGLSGCTAASSGKDVDTIAYVMGSFKTTDARNFPTVYPATKKALDQLGWTTTKITDDAVSAIIIARNDGDVKLKVKLDGTPTGTTEIIIRYGLRGHEAESQKIYDQIMKNLQ